MSHSTGPSPDVLSQLASIHCLSDSELCGEYQQIPVSLGPSGSFLDAALPEDKHTIMRLCLLHYAVSNQTRCPRGFQIDAALALLNGRDCLVDAGTGSGKTLCMVLPMLLDPSGITITISPLKRLQSLQATEFRVFGINTIAINEDTP